MVFTAGVLLFAIFSTVYCASPEVPCPVPISPEHGQTFLYQEGLVVKYVCEPGYSLKGKEIVRCIEGKWEEPNPTCLEVGLDGVKEDTEKVTSDLDPIVPPPPRPLFSWGSDNEQEINATGEELPLSDEARIRLLMLPRRRIITEVRTAKIRSATELEEEEKKRSKEDKTDSTTIHLEANPSVVYVRRTVIPGKSDTARKALHMTVENGNDVQLITVPEEKVVYGYFKNGVVSTLTDSQLAWIDSLPADLREQYLKDVHMVRIGDAVDSSYMQTLVARDAYNYVYHVPYARRPVSLIVEDPVATYDYSCHVSGYPFIKAPRLRNMHIARYDKRQNPNNPYNHYLTAVYRCNPGYIMLDTRHTELHCSQKDWVGVRPVCVRIY